MQAPREPSGQGPFSRPDPSAVREAAEALFARWTDALLARMDGGSVPCDACPGMRHGRAVELVRPFVARWRATGDARWLDAAASAVDWAERALRLPDGCYANDPGDGWLGTTEFAQTALAKALLAGGDALPAPLRARWLGILRRLSDWLRGWIDPPDFVVNVNYRAAHALAMELAARVLGDGSYRASGAAQARRCLALVAPADGLLFGETRPPESVSPRGLRGVDVGYNLEESLPALAEWAELAGDSDALGAVLRCARVHLPFVLPDGAIDDSFGSRAYKWSWWGSRTSDGVLPLLAALARRGDPVAAARVPAVLGLWERCTTRDGLLAGGPDYEAAGEPACVHHTICHAKALADFLEGRTSELGGRTPEPRPPADGEASLRSFPTCGAHVAEAGPWRATFSESDVRFHGTLDESVGGGCLALLWHRALGPLCAATMARYGMPERNNAQPSRTDPATRCLTPRLETPDGARLSVCAHDAHVAVRAEGGAVVAEAEGRLRGLDGAEGPAFSLRHRLSPDGLEIRARCDAPARLVVPIVARPDEPAALAPDGRSATVARHGGTLSLRAVGAPLSVLPTARPDGRAFCPVPGLLCVPFALSLPAGAEATLLLSVPRSRA